MDGCSDAMVRGSLWVFFFLRHEARDVLHDTCKGSS
jgi:hypothetical protein